VYRPSDGRLSEKLMQTFADRGFSHGQCVGSPTAVISVFYTVWFSYAQKTCTYFMILISLSLENAFSSAGSVPLLSHLISCTPFKSNLYFDSSTPSLVNLPYTHVYVPWTESHIHIKLLSSFIHRIHPGSRTVWMVRNRIIFTVRVVVPTPSPQVELLPLVGCPHLLIHCIRSYPLFLEAVPPSAMLWW
jgi:hypothetical protein